MSRLILFITLVLSLLALSACSVMTDCATDGKLLTISYPGTLDITLKSEASTEKRHFKLILEDKYKGEIRFSDFDGNENGYFISFENGKAEICYGEIKTPLPDEFGQRIFAFCSAFSPDKEDLISVELSDESGVKNNLLTYSVYLPSENEEERKYSGEVSVLVDSESKRPIKITGELCGEPFEAVINY